MNFIKSIWTRVKSFFGGLFAGKKVAKPAVAANPVVAPTAAPAANEATIEAPVAAFPAASKEELANLFNRCVEAATYRNYKLDEAYAAYHNGDEAALVRIERAMRNKNYKFKAYKAPVAKAA